MIKLHYQCTILSFIYTIQLFGDHMDIILYGIDYPHKRGEFCIKRTIPHYFLSHFRTDYVAELDGKTIRGKAGDYMILEPGRLIYHGPIPDTTQGFRNDWLYVSGKDLESILARYPLPLNRPFRLDSSFYLTAAIERIHKEKSFSLSGFAEKCDLIMKEMLIDMYRAFERSEFGTAKDKLELARGEIMKEYAKPWTVEQMAALTGYSPSRFAALYKAQYGISPISDLINRRLEQAKLLMLYENIPQTEIAATVGFSSIYYFSKYFKKKEGLSPTEYKKQQTR